LRFLSRFEAAKVLLNQVGSVELANCDVIAYAVKKKQNKNKQKKTLTTAFSFLVT